MSARRVSDRLLLYWIEKAELDYGTKRWDEDFVEVMLDLRDVSTALAASQAAHRDALDEIAGLKERLVAAERAGWIKGRDSAAQAVASFKLNADQIFQLDRRYGTLMAGSQVFADVAQPTLAAHVRAALPPDPTNPRTVSPGADDGDAGQDARGVGHG